MIGMVLLSLAALSLSVGCLRLTWGHHIASGAGLWGSVVLLAIGIAALVPALGEGRATMAVVAAVLPCGMAVVLLGRERRRGRGQAAITRRPEGAEMSLHLGRWILAGPVAGMASFALALAPGFLPGMATETRIAIVLCVWPVVWAGLGMVALSADRPSTSRQSPPAI